MTNSPMSRLSAETEASAYAGIRRQAQIDALRWALPYVRAANRHDVFEGLLRLEAGGRLEEGSDEHKE